MGGKFGGRNPRGGVSGTLTETGAKSLGLSNMFASNVSLMQSMESVPAFKVVKGKGIPKKSDFRESTQSLERLQQLTRLPLRREGGRKFDGDISKRTQ